MKVIAVMSLVLGVAVVGFAQTAPTARQLWLDQPTPKAQPPKPKPARAKVESTTTATKKRPDTVTAAPVEEVSTRPSNAVTQPQAQFVNAASTVTTRRPFGLRYSLIRIVNGSPVEVSPDSTFHSGDEVGVRVEGNQDGYMYVVVQGSSGNWELLFPRPEIAGGDNRIQAHRRYQLPSEEHDWVFDSQPGTEKLFILYSPEPVRDVDSVIYSLQEPEKPEKPENRMIAQNFVSDNLIMKVRNEVQSRDLILQKISAPAGSDAPQRRPAQADAPLPENAAYVVNRAGGRVVVDIPLKHEQ